MIILFTNEERKYFTYEKGNLKFNDDCPNEIKISVKNKFNSVVEHNRKKNEDAKKFSILNSNSS